jgi:hypothetical protein
MGGACSGGRMRVRMRAADRFPLAGVASARETGRNWAGASIPGLAFLVVVDLRCGHLLSISAQNRSDRQEINNNIFGVDIYFGLYGYLSMLLLLRTFAGFTGKSGDRAPPWSTSGLQILHEDMYNLLNEST